MAQKGRAAGLEQDPVYQARVNEFHKTHLINFHRTRLLGGMEPSAAEIDAYFAKNKDRITVPEARKIQMVVLKTREEAEEIKNKIQSGELTLYQVAKEYSIDPHAQQTLGEMGWVTKGTGFPELDKTHLLPRTGRDRRAGRVSRGLAPGEGAGNPGSPVR